MNKYVHSISQKRISKVHVHITLDREPSAMNKKQGDRDKT